MAGEGLPPPKGGGGSCKVSGSTDSGRSSDVPTPTTSSGETDATDQGPGPSQRTLGGLQEPASVYLSCLPELPAQRSYHGGPQGQEDGVAGAADRADAFALAPYSRPGESLVGGNSSCARACCWVRESHLCCHVICAALSCA